MKEGIDLMAIYQEVVPLHQCSPDHIHPHSLRSENHPTEQT